MKKSRIVSLAMALCLLPLTVHSKDTVTIYWEELMPSHLLEKLEGLPMLEHDYSEDAADPFTDDWEDPYADAWNESLTSTEVVERYAGERIRLPGFIVPLDIDHQQRVESFFFVPYFGACIHVPPPPPNQLIHVSEVPDDVTIKVDHMYDAFWLTGVLSLDKKSHEMGVAAYSIDMDKLVPYRHGDDY